VRLIMSQSAGSGLANIDCVTGTNACARAQGALNSRQALDSIAAKQQGARFMSSSQ
jgi:hypothetical protein